MYLFLIAHSSRIEANFINGAPEKKIVQGNKSASCSKIYNAQLHSNANKNRHIGKFVLTVKLHHSLLDHWFELA
jgi:hypothetical protein